MPKEKQIFYSNNSEQLWKKGSEYFRTGDASPLSKPNDEGKSVPFTQEDFDQLITDRVSAFVDRSFENIVVLAGAGASVVMNENGSINKKYGKTVAMIAQKVFSELSKKTYTFRKRDDANAQTTVVDVYSLEELSGNKIANYESQITKFDSKTGKTILDGNRFNLEEFLSRLLTYISLRKRKSAKLVDSRDAVFDIIEGETGYEYDNDKMKHTALIKFLSKKLESEKKLELVTTNYDTLIEDAAEGLDYTVIDGFSFSRKPKFDDDMFEWHLSKHVDNVKTRENIYKTQVIDLLKIHGSLTWRKEGKSVVRTDKMHAGTPVMIFPSRDKYMQSYEEPYFELFSRFQAILRRPNTLLITIGFSFADNHISRMILEAIKHNPGLNTLISDFEIAPENPNDNWIALNGLMGDTYPVIFVGATLNEKLVKYLGASYEHQ